MIWALSVRRSEFWNIMRSKLKCNFWSGWSVKKKIYLRRKSGAVERILLRDARESFETLLANLSCPNMVHTSTGQVICLQMARRSDRSMWQTVIFKHTKLDLTYFKSDALDTFLIITHKSYSYFLPLHCSAHSFVHTDLTLFYSFFWEIPGRLNVTCRRFGTICLFHLHRCCKQE